MYRYLLALFLVMTAVSLACVLPSSASSGSPQALEIAQLTTPVEETPSNTLTVVPSKTPTQVPSPTTEIVEIVPTVPVQTRLLEKGHALLTPPDDPWKAISWDPIRTSRVVIPTPDAKTVDIPTFIENIPQADKAAVAGVSAPGVFEYPVVQQPNGNNGFVSSEPNTVTQYGHPLNYGVVGLLAHDMEGMAGLGFYLLKPGQEIVLVYGDGSTATYVVQRILKFRALSPHSEQSDFEYLEDTQADGEHQIGTIYDYGTVYNWMYTGTHHVTFQTCLEGTTPEGYQDLSWGRFFVLAYPK